MKKTEWVQIEALVGNGADDERVFLRSAGERQAVVWANPYGLSGAIFNSGVTVCAELNSDEADREVMDCGDDYEIIITVDDNGTKRTISIDSLGDAYESGEDLDIIDLFSEFEEDYEIEMEEFDNIFELFKTI